jgi:predicted ArsR family transcriptional regulator
MEQRPLADRVAAVSALDEPIRRALFDHVSRRHAPVSRDEAAEAVGLARSTAAFHLDRLADEGLLAVEFRRLSGRTGPGAGRPAKLYRRAAGEVAVTVPERHYDFAAQLLLTAIEEATRTGAPAAETLLRTAGQTGRTLGSDAGSLAKVLEDHGYEPRPDGGGGMILGNCPFHRLAQQHTETVCHVNLELLRGAADGSNDRRHTMVLDPGIGRCCVRAVPRHPATRVHPGPTDLTSSSAQTSTTIRVGTGRNPR